MHLLHTLLTHQNLTLTAIPNLQIHCVVAATALSRPTRVVLTQQLVQFGVGLAPFFCGGLAAVAGVGFLEFVAAVEAEELLAAPRQKVAAVVQMAVLAQKLGHFEIINKRLLMGEISRLGDMWGGVE